MKTPIKRLENYNVLFLTGTDEHGQKIEKEAKKNNKDPKIFCDELSENFRSLTKTLSLSNDDFIRTSEERHKKAVSEIWIRMKEKRNPIFCVSKCLKRCLFRVKPKDEINFII